MPTDSNPLNNPYLELNLLRDVCKDSFYQFCRNFWDIVVSNPAHWNWHMEYLCQKLQDTAIDVLNGRPKKHDLIVALPPGTGKSTILSILFPAWLHCHNPKFRFITASFDYTLATEFGRKTKLVMDSPLYQRLFYKFKYSPDRQGHYINQYGGERMVFSVGQAPTGRHANLIICDDIVNPLDAGREVNIRETTFWMNAVIRPRVVSVGQTPFILVMQRLHTQDPVGEWLTHKDAKIFHVSLPASLDSGVSPVPKGLKRYYQDGLLDSVRLSRSDLQQHSQWMTHADYEAQYNQNPLLHSGLMFKTANISVRHIDLTDPIESICRYWDKAIAVSDTACYTAGVKLGRTRSGRWCVMDVKRGRWGLYDRENLIRNTAVSDGTMCMVGLEIEPGPLRDNSSVLMYDGLYKPLCEVAIGDYVINQLGKITKVLDVHHQGALPCLKIMTNSSRIVYAASSHPFLTSEGYKDAGSLAVGDNLTLALHKPPHMRANADGGVYNFFPDSIVEIVDGGEHACMCLTVEDGESFICNDFVVHNSGGKESADNTIRNLAGFTVIGDHPPSAKEVRARPFAIQVEQGNVFCIAAAWNDEYFSELAAFPQSKYKDQVDASVGAFNFLINQRSRVACAF